MAEKVTKTLNDTVSHTRISSTNQRKESIDAQMRAIRGYAQINAMKRSTQYMNKAQLNFRFPTHIFGMGGGDGLWRRNR